MCKGNGLLSVKRLKAIVKKFENTGSLNFQSDIGHKPVQQNTIEDDSMADDCPQSRGQFQT